MVKRPAIATLGLIACSVSCLAQGNPNCHGPEPLELAAQANPTAKNWAALGGWFGEKHEFVCAIQAFQSALLIEPHSASLHYYLGLTLHSAGQSKPALAELQSSIDLDPNQLRPRLLSGLILNETGERARAEEAWEAALQVDPSSVIALDWLAKARISDGQFLAAIDLLNSAPSDVDLSLDLAVAYSEAGLFDNAADVLAAALTNTPGDLRLSAALATVCVQSHRYEDAIKPLRAALHEHPDDLTTEILYLRLLVLAGDDREVRPLAARLLAAHPNNFDALYLSGILENDAQDFSLAVEHLKTAVALNPNHFDARYNLGIALNHLQQNEAAREQLERAVALDPTDAQAHFHLAQALRALGQSDEAQTQLKLFQQRQLARTKLALGQTKAAQAAQALKNGDATLAVTLYREAIDAQPQDAILEYDLALALERTGDSTQERAALERAIELKSSFAAAENRLGVLESQAGHSAAAELHFRNALAASPGFAEASNNLGALLGKEGRDSDAEERFRSAVLANPRFTRAWVNLAATLASESRFPEARDAADRAVKIDPHDPDALRLQQMLHSAPDTPTSSTPSATPDANSGFSPVKVPR